MALVERIAIIGVGLIGGSFARALRKHQLVDHIIGFDSNTDNLKQAIEMGVIDSAAATLDNVVKKADVIVLATPVLVTEQLLVAITTHLEPATVVTDVGSTKANIVAVAKAALGARFAHFVPGHPIAGTEQSGAAAAFAELFVDHTIILTPTPETDPKACQLITDIWQAFGAKVVYLDAYHHDKAAAAASHLPHMLAYALVDCLAKLQDDDDLLGYAAAAGLADFTRIVSSDATMWRDICLSNRDLILELLTLFNSDLDQLKKAIKNADSEKLVTIFQRAKRTRAQLLCKDKL